MKKFLILYALLITCFGLMSCEENQDNHFDFKYALGNSTDYRVATEAAFYFYPNDSAAQIKVKFGNGDVMDLLWMTKCYKSKTTYLFGQTYGIDSDIMINKFENNESNPPYWAMDQGIYKSGNITFTSWTDNRVTGNFDFDANTLNPVDLSSAVLNFKGDFDLPVKQ